ncbi:cupin domain-containing protein [Parasedimentitalea huanghaiensis]|uniref:Cupin domain-containing protein n=1 Tax=Parasedimentitalea huanghaiensis TaxID=2682100 RepID=A0A6L6WN91_9RHOB|nr:cupin domain-containing protein [Zongyanglinia huanghaiensis]MVO17092.1 cupin domain-containing protein [Zongyanglinia huanghaiensis]
MGLRFIFMLTRNDKTVEDAEQHLATALAAGVHHIGFKDVGLPFERLTDLNAAIKSGGATSYLEVVSLDKESEVASAKAAIDIGVDILLGGTNVDEVLPILKGTGIRYYPFPGRIEGHPSVLAGSIDEIVESAQALAARDGVHGLDLLAYRSTENVTGLMAAVCAAVDKPVIMAGSIGSRERIEIVRRSGAAGFTIGTAALDGDYPADSPELETQLRSIQRDVAGVNKHLSSHTPTNLDACFATFTETWSPRIAGQVNNMMIKLAKFEGEFLWHHHEVEDELFMVHRGKLMMKFRDRDEIINEGEFIIVPHGVEHCPVALDGTCEVLLLEPATTVNTGNADDPRRVTDLARV